MNWPALMAIGLGALRLPPATFWSMTPLELNAALGAGRETPLTRDRFEALAARWPDADTDEETDDG